eukprot:2487834-Rhodomonas_salina.1
MRWVPPGHARSASAGEVCVEEPGVAPPPLLSIVQRFHSDVSRYAVTCARHAVCAVPALTQRILVRIRTAMSGAHTENSATRRMYDCDAHVEELLATSEAKKLQKTFPNLNNKLLKVQFRKLLQAVKLFPVSGSPRLDGMHQARSLRSTCALAMRCTVLTDAAPVRP